VALADTTEINAFVIDVKDATGYLTYRSSVATAVEIGANELVRAPDTRARLAALEARGIHPIARIVVARDALLATRRSDWAVQDIDGGLWLDGLGDRSVYVSVIAHAFRGTTEQQQQIRRLMAHRHDVIPVPGGVLGFGQVFRIMPKASPGP